MNSSKCSNFLDRFNGKIGVVTKHGELMARSSFQQKVPKKAMTENFTNLNRSKNLKVLTQAPSVRDTIRNDKFSLSRTIQRSQADSLHSKNQIRMLSETEEGKLSLYKRRSNAKQNLISAGQNLLSNGFTKTPGRGAGMQKYNSLSWEIKDKQTNDFYEELTNLQMSKVSSFSQNPKVHL